MRPPTRRALAIFVASLMAVFAGSGTALADHHERSATGDAADAEQGKMRPTGSLMVNGLRTPAAFAYIKDDEARARALFAEIAKVMQHPRCANCHPVSGGPRQGDRQQAHIPPVGRGIAGIGPYGMQCTTCHGTSNATYVSMTGSIPGAQPWRLAPSSMGWLGHEIDALCEQIKDQSRNGGRSLDDLVAHHTKDHLVNWAWHPGEGRTPAPGDQETFGALTAAWVAAGAGCP